MTQEAKLSNTQQTEGSLSALTAAGVDDPRLGSDIPPQCSLQWDALNEASRAVDAAIAVLEERAIAMRDCVLGLNKPVQPWPAPAPGGEYVNVTNAPAAHASAMSYRRRQIDETIGLIAGARRRLKDLLRTP